MIMSALLFSGCAATGPGKRTPGPVKLIVKDTGASPPTASQNGSSGVEAQAASPASGSSLMPAQRITTDKATSEVKGHYDVCKKCTHLDAMTAGKVETTATDWAGFTQVRPGGGGSLQEATNRAQTPTTGSKPSCCEKEAAQAPVKSASGAASVTTQPEKEPCGCCDKKATTNPGENLLRMLDDAKRRKQLASATEPREAQQLTPETNDSPTPSPIPSGQVVPSTLPELKLRYEAVLSVVKPDGRFDFQFRDLIPELALLGSTVKGLGSGIPSEQELANLGERLAALSDQVTVKKGASR